jgi:lipopolysaccharide/colanic/teichoic acid biosynthesis glycosyltransferase
VREIPERLRRWRETVRPGMTGLWQVSGRSDAGTAGIIFSDAYYLRHWSIWLDIVILVRTLRVLWKRTGAY